MVRPPLALYDTGIWTVFAKVAGIGGIGLGVVLVVVRDIIRKNIFPKFKDEHLAYRLLRLLLVLAFSAGLRRSSHDRTQAGREFGSSAHPELMRCQILLWGGT